MPFQRCTLLAGEPRCTRYVRVRLRDDLLSSRKSAPHIPTRCITDKTMTEFLLVKSSWQHPMQRIGKLFRLRLSRAS